MIDLQALGTLVFSRLYSDPEGAAVRALLGQAALSIVHAEDLRKETFPPRPFLAFRGGPVVQLDRFVRLPIYTWWIYDDPQQRYVRIDGLARPIALAYAARKLHLTSGGLIGSVEIGPLGAQLPDLTLGLVQRALQVNITAI